MTDPVRLADILHSICACGQAAIVRYEAGRHGDNYRAAQACARHEAAARRWVAEAARAGPLREHRLTTTEAPQGDTPTLF